MPKIPIYDPAQAPQTRKAPRAPMSLVEPAGQPQDPRAMTLSGQVSSQLYGTAARGMASVGGAMMAVAEAGEKASRLGMHIVEHVQSAKALDAHANYEKELALEAQRIKQDPEITPDQYAEKFREAGERLYESHSDGLIGPWADKFAAAATATSARAQVAMNDLAWEDSLKRRMAATVATQERLLAEYGYAAPARQAEIRQELESEYSYLVKIKAVDPKAAAETRRALDKRLIMEEIKGALIVDPDKASNLLVTKQGDLDADTYYKLNVMIETAQAKKERKVLTEQLGKELSAYSGQNPALVASSLEKRLADGSINPSVAEHVLSNVKAMHGAREQAKEAGRRDYDRRLAAQLGQAWIAGDQKKVMALVKEGFEAGSSTGLHYAEALQREQRTAGDSLAKSRLETNWGVFVGGVRSGEITDLAQIDAVKLLTPVERGGYGLPTEKLDEAFNLVKSSQDEARKGGVNYFSEAKAWASKAFKDNPEQVAKFVLTLERHREAFKDKAGNKLTDYSPELMDVATNLMETSGTGLFGGTRAEALEKERRAGKSGLLTDHPDWFDRTAPEATTEKIKQTRQDLTKAQLPDTPAGRAALKSGRGAAPAQLLEAWGPGFDKLSEQYGMDKVALARRTIEEYNNRLPVGAKAKIMDAQNVERQLIWLQKQGR